MTIAQALRQTDQPEAMLGSLLDIWRQTRDPFLAEVVELAGRRVSRPPLESRPADKALKAWLACAKKHDDADLDRLIAALQVGKVKEIIQRLEVLAAGATDPRLTTLAATLLETQPFRSGAARPIYTAIINLLEAQQDPRAIGRLERVKKQFMPGKGLEGGTDFRDFFSRKLERALDKARKVAAPKPLDTASTRALATLASKLEAAAALKQQDTKGELELLSAIWKSPTDDTVRQVYADFLSERGNPHGEFITLQLADADGRLDAAGKKRMKALQKEHARAFLGPLQPAITLTNLRFERGFVAHCELADKMSPQIQAIEAHPGWSTVKSFFAFTGDTSAPSLMKHLKSLGAKRKKDRFSFLAQFEK